MLYYSDDDPERDFDDLSGDSPEALAVSRAECDRSRRIVEEADSLEAMKVRVARSLALHASDSGGGGVEFVQALLRCGGPDSFRATVGGRTPGSDHSGRSRRSR